MREREKRVLAGVARQLEDEAFQVWVSIDGEVSVLLSTPVREAAENMYRSLQSLLREEDVEALRELLSFLEGLNRNKGISLGREVSSQFT